MKFFLASFCPVKPRPIGWGAVLTAESHPRRLVALFLWIFLCLCCTGGANGLLNAVPSAVSPPPPTILFFGDSLTSGFGLAHPAEESFVALIQKKIAAAGLPWRVINAGISGNFTSDGLRRIGPAMQDGPPAVLVLELGANDGLRRLPVVQTQANLQAIIDAARSKNPAVKIVLAGMKLPTSYGGYADNFAAIYPALARSNQTILIPFLLEGVGGVPALNQPDGIHPTASGHTKVAEIVWLWLRPLLSQ